MNRKLSTEQIKKLFAFCKSKEIYDYDLQIEIVDHLASSIEDQWQADSRLSFGWALKNVYSRFGRNGFRKIEKQITKQLKRKFNRMLWTYLLEYFKFPKLIITILLTLSLFSILQMVNNNSWVVILFTVPLSLISIYYNFRLFPKKIEIKPVHGKSFMILKYLEKINVKTGSIAQLPLTAIMFSSAFRLRFTNSVLEELAISIILSMLSVLLYGYFFYIPKKIKEHFMEQYGEFAV